ncbi:MAG: N-acetyltransferase [Sulfobacillus acidophilus]|uniref:N-acetyltransferase n=1 Tax=Sulfobacillus acidophilus TaxID=53633 RepID=A0A2T2WFP8_9FIRM|nr:MAG: N-acetyltransferase [Sulfobacillus acidophilus]
MKPKLWPPYFRHYRVNRIHWGDIRQIASLERAVFLEPLALNRIWRYYLSRRCGYLVVKDGRAVIAYFGFELCGGYAHVIANVTHPTYRKQGLATFVLTAAEPWAKAMGALAFLGEVRKSNVGQLRVLHSIGWTDVIMIPAFFGNGEDAQIVMKVFS